MSTLAKLRALHEEVCYCWRRYSDPSISEGEAEVLNLGFLLLEGIVSNVEAGEQFVNCFHKPERLAMITYLQRVHGQFDDDADIRITGEQPHA